MPGRSKKKKGNKKEGFFCRIMAALSKTRDSIKEKPSKFILLAMLLIAFLISFFIIFIIFADRIIELLYIIFSQISSTPFNVYDNLFTNASELSPFIENQDLFLESYDILLKESMSFFIMIFISCCIFIGLMFSRLVNDNSLWKFKTKERKSSMSKNIKAHAAYMARFTIVLLIYSAIVFALLYSFSGLIFNNLLTLLKFDMMTYLIYVLFSILIIIKFFILNMFIAIKDSSIKDIFRDWINISFKKARYSIPGYLLLLISLILPLCILVLISAINFMLWLLLAIAFIFYIIAVLKAFVYFSIDLLE